jgi:hypothetical protein
MQTTCAIRFAAFLESEHAISVSTASIVNEEATSDKGVAD